MSKNPNDSENTIPYEQINAGSMRKEAESKGSVDPAMHSKHEAEIAKMDRGQGSEKGGR